MEFIAELCDHERATGGGRSSASDSQRKRDIRAAGYPASDSVDGNAHSGWAVGGHAGKPCEITWTLAQPLPWPMDRPLRLILEQNHGSEHLLRGFQLSLAFDDTPPEQLAQRRREYAAQAYAKWLQMVGAQTGAWQLLKPTNVAANMARLEPQNDGSYLAIGDISKRDEYQFQLNLEAGTTALMIEGLTDPSLPKRGPGRTYYEGPYRRLFPERGHPSKARMTRA